MKYYYNCPIKAAYMEKYHGLRLQDSYGDEEGEMRDKDLSSGIDGESGPFYIHPESVKLLKPLGEDFVIMATKRCGDMALKHYQTSTANADVNPMPLGAMEFKYILQRNNLPFIWPEVEWIWMI